MGESVLRAYFLVGVRPNIVKMTPLFQRATELPDVFKIRLIHTGQHYDAAFHVDFIKSLEAPMPDVNLGAHAQDIALQTNLILNYYKNLDAASRPDFAVVFGDANCSAASAIAMSMLEIPVVHVEAGLRCGNPLLKEENNRIVIDLLSDALFVTEKSAVENLARERHSSDNIFFTGNIMIDSLVKNQDKINSSTLARKLGLDSEEYIVVTIHREENTWNPENLASIFKSLEILSEKYIVVFPAHPGTVRKAAEHNLEFPTNRNIMLIPPLRYVDCISLMKNASAVITDSGGVQEETTFLKTPCVTVRKNTERPVTISHGTNRLSPAVADEIVRNCRDAIKDVERYESQEPPELWDGKTAERIINVIRERYV